MTKCETMAALQSWNMAIYHALANNTPITDLESLAHTYGTGISTPENIEAASHLFNWIQLEKIIVKVNK